MRYRSVIQWILTLAAIGALAACGDGERVVDGKLQLRFGEACYRIPQWNTELVHASAAPPMSAKRGANSLRLQFATAAMAEAIPGFHALTDVHGKPLNSRMVSLFLRTPEEIARDDGNLRTANYDIWYGLDGYAGRVVEAVPGTSLYRIYPSQSSWMVVSQRPDERTRDTHLSRNFWIGTCSFSTRVGGATADERRCSTHVDAGELTAQFDMKESDLALRDRVMDYVRSKLLEWKVDCAER